MSITLLANENSKLLCGNAYPGRGIVIGLSPDKNYFIQMYWIMGRSENSRNRIFKSEDGFVKTEAFQKENMVDPSLILYYPIKHYNNCHIVSNGDQTDTIFDSLSGGQTFEFEDALFMRKFEPDFPNFTPRISGIVDLDDPKHAYKLSILKSINNDPENCLRSFFNYEKAIPGFGHCIHTYSEDGDPLPSFQDEPFVVELFNDMNHVADYYWNILNEENKISLLVKFISIQNKTASIKIINKHKGDI